MDECLYLMMIKRTKTYNKMTKAVVTRHVEHLRKLDDMGKLEFTGILKGYPGIAGMVILKTQSFEEADELCKQEPMVAEGYAGYTLNELQAANKENNYLLS